MSENESNWWLARSKRVPFLTEQVNMSGGQHAMYTHWLKRDYLDDEEAVKKVTKQAQDRLKKEAEERLENGG